MNRFFSVCECVRVCVCAWVGVFAFIDFRPVLSIYLAVGLERPQSTDGHLSYVISLAHSLNPINLISVQPDHLQPIDPLSQS